MKKILVDSLKLRVGCHSRVRKKTEKKEEQLRPGLARLSSGARVQDVKANLTCAVNQELRLLRSLVEQCGGGSRRLVPHQKWGTPALASRVRCVISGSGKIGYNSVAHSHGTLVSKRE